MRKNRSIVKMTLIILLPVPLFLILWEILSRSGLYNTTLLPPPSVVFRTLLEMVRSGELITDLFASLKRATIGFLIGAIVGILLGFLTGWKKIFSNTIGQLIQLFRPIPPIAIIPLVMLLMGIGETSKYFIIVFGVFFPMWLNTYIGVTRVETKYIWAAKSLGATNGKIFYEIIFPAASPFIIAGTRISIAIALICLVAAEMSAASEGLGFRITYSHLIFRPDKMIANLIVLGVVGATLDQLFVRLRNKMIPWYQPTAKK